MTNRQISHVRNIRKFASFANNIGKLKKGNSVRFTKIGETAEADTPFGVVTCVTKGVRPRQFVVAGSAVMPNGLATYKAIMAALINRF